VNATFSIFFVYWIEKRSKGGAIRPFQSSVRLTSDTKRIDFSPPIVTLLRKLQQQQQHLLIADQS